MAKIIDILFGTAQKQLIYQTCQSKAYQNVLMWEC